MPKYNVIVLEGKRCMKVSSFITKTDNLFSNRFQAFWYYISKNNMNNKQFIQLKNMPIVKIYMIIMAIL